MLIKAEPCTMDSKPGAVEWTTGIDYWNGLLEWTSTTGMEYWNGILE